MYLDLGQWKSALCHTNGLRSFEVFFSHLYVVFVDEGVVSFHKINPCVVFGSVGPVSSFQQKKTDIWNHSFNLRLTGLGSFSVKNRLNDTFSVTAHCTHPQHIYITYMVLGSTGPEGNNSVEIVGAVYLQFFTIAKTQFLKLGPCLSKLHTQKPKSDTQNAKHFTFLVKVNATFKST